MSDRKNDTPMSMDSWKNGASSDKLVIHMIGNAHLDPVWLWDWAAGADEAVATFRSAADRCDEYPEFIYTRGESWLYRTVEELDPELFARVERLVQEGRWSIAGGQFIQPDANLPTLAGWKKQFELGRRYFRERFGVVPRIAYNVDTFGHPATLPDILSEQGYMGYVFHRPLPKQVPLPSEVFRWRGAEGAELLGFRISPSYVTRIDDLYGQIMLTADAANRGLGHTMCFYGLGNHGGGPSKAAIEYIIENKHAFPGLELRFSTVDAFFKEAHRYRENLPVVSTELQHTLVGCYSVMHEPKCKQVRGEHYLDQANDFVEHFETDVARVSDFGKILDRCWDDLLFTQFHDILAGTSVPSSWASTAARQGRARIAAEEVVLSVTRRWSKANLPKVNHQQIAILNSFAEDFDDYISCEPFLDFDDWGRRWISDMDGNAIPFQLVVPESNMGRMVQRIVFRTQVPGRDGRVLLVRDDEQPASLADPSSDLVARDSILGNGRVCVELAPWGIRRITSGGRELLGENGVRLQLRQDMQDTWVFHSDSFREPVLEQSSELSWQIEESGPLRARVWADGRIGDSSFRWTLTLHRDDPRVFMRIDVNFAERFRLLQMPVQLSEAVGEWEDGLAGGSVCRQPSASEWPVQGWSCVRGGGMPMALVTPDAYSLSLEDDVWQWTLLRSPLMAWAGQMDLPPSSQRTHTDQGTHSFEFALHVGENCEPESLATAARRMARAPVVFDRYEGMNRPSWGNHPPRHLWTEDIHRARADGLSVGEESVDTGGFWEAQPVEAT